MSREIRCFRCTTYLGEVRDAKLKKGMNHICGDCTTALQALEMSHRMDDGKSTYGNIFGDVFSDIFGKGKFRK